jgi:hypothetical protein
MKALPKYAAAFIFYFICHDQLIFAQFTTELMGAWEAGTDPKQTMIVSEQFFAVAIYDQQGKKFVSTYGGRWKSDGKVLVETIEFNSESPEQVGKKFKLPYALKSGKFSLTEEDKKTEWTRLDNGKPGQLAGAWLITGRMQPDGQLRTMTPGAQRTMKILSGTCFQWIAYNIDKKQFLATGGGNYTTQNGQYTENILFFSRDNNRVGSSLEFEFSLRGGNWNHKGKSSKGDSIHEIWTRREKLGL